MAEFLVFLCGVLRGFQACVVMVLVRESLEVGMRVRVMTTILQQNEASC